MYGGNGWVGRSEECDVHTGDEDVSKVWEEEEEVGEGRRVESTFSDVAGQSKMMEGRKRSRRKVYLIFVESHLQILQVDRRLDDLPNARQLDWIVDDEAAKLSRSTI